MVFIFAKSTDLKVQFNIIFTIVHTHKQHLKLHTLLFICSYL